MDFYEKVVFAAERALEALSSEKKKNIKGNHLLDWAIANSSQFDFPVEPLKTSWGAYLTRAISDSNTRIAREPGKYSLILKDKESGIVQESIQEENSSSTDTQELNNTETAEYQKREEVLYSLLSEWLTSKKYNAEVTANIKKGNRWGNPDIVGILLLDDP